MERSPVGSVSGHAGGDPMTSDKHRLLARSCETVASLFIMSVRLPTLVDHPGRLIQALDSH
jgi:hypothetical protein